MWPKLKPYFAKSTNYWYFKITLMVQTWILFKIIEKSVQVTDCCFKVTVHSTCRLIQNLILVWLKNTKYDSSFNSLYSFNSMYCMPRNTVREQTQIKFKSIALKNLWYIWGNSSIHTKMTWKQTSNITCIYKLLSNLKHSSKNKTKQNTHLNNS